MRIKAKSLSEYSLLARIIMWAQKRKYGETLAPALLWGQSPKLLYGLQAFYRAIDRNDSPLDPMVRALVNIKVAQMNHCLFCVDIGSSLLAKRLGRVDEMNEKVSALRDFEGSGVFSEREKSALAYAQGMTLSPGGVDEALFTRLRAQFSDAEIIELTAVIGYQNLSAKFNSALDVPAQGFCLPQKNREEKRV